MLVRKSLLVSSVALVVCAQALAGCGGGQKPLDTTKLFNVQSTFGSDFKTQTKGPNDIDPKILGPQKMPPGVTFDPADCEEYAANTGRPPKGIRGKMSMVSIAGNGNQLVAIAMQTDQDLHYDDTDAEKCSHVTFSAGKLTGYLDDVEAPEIDHAKTTGTHSEIEIVGKDGQQQSRESYTFTAYLGSALVQVTANPQPVRGQPPAMVDADRARELLVDAVSALRD
ncbi:hypothetical protein AWC18_18430 [Mycolicibacter nonchromogenicus]|uniref:DUF5642 domain-containing protein n=1 Tax=Mycolicibacter nonchromogenicus TaxID=1782 RepID=A0A1X1Z006_MYCNO|nr:DUF5642 family protein [Mycolicibacter nonchromogenicus]OBI07418.1 hypothetical protein A5715_17715 [Mycolicibacter heraklionensis]ORW16665.1 hypothetical protein AWC18_18430 [Mycolicibacter nonchromogenicus]